MQSLHSCNDASHTRTRDGVSFPTRARFSMEAKSDSAADKFDGEVWMRAVAWASLVVVSSVRSMRSSSSPPWALPDDIVWDGGGCFVWTCDEIRFLDTLLCLYRTQVNRNVVLKVVEGWMELCVM